MAPRLTFDPILFSVIGIMVLFKKLMYRCLHAASVGVTATGVFYPQVYCRKQRLR